jgi:hypothetical protein
MSQGSHRIYMTSFVRSGWNVAFLEADCRTSLPRKYTFSNPEKIREIAQRGQATPELLEDLENDITNGRGGCWLELTPEQYAALR